MARWLLPSRELGQRLSSHIVIQIGSQLSCRNPNAFYAVGLWGAIQVLLNSRSERGKGLTG
jgi:hypothetical protein